MGSMKIGRPSDYTKWKARAICIRIASGQSLREICKLPGYPSRYAVFRWLNSNESFRNQYVQARDAQCEVFLEDMLSISETESGDDDTAVRVQRDKLRTDTLKWVMERMGSKRYGTRQMLDHTSSDRSMSPKGLDDFYKDIPPKS